MVSQPLVEYDSSQMAVYNMAAYILPTSQYSTIITNFPGAMAHKPWGEKGQFFISSAFYQEGKRIADIHSDWCNEEGHIHMEFDDVAYCLDRELAGIAIIQFTHTKTISPNLYMAHIHKETGAYIAYPAGGFIGEQLHPDTHSRELENTLFWPGVICNENTQAKIVIANPYKVSFGYQLSLFLNDNSRVQTTSHKLKPYMSKVHSIEETFPDYAERIANSQGDYSICVAAQYKVVCYMMFQNRKNNIITTIDHLHRYCLY